MCVVLLFCANQTVSLQLLMNVLRWIVLLHCLYRECNLTLRGYDRVLEKSFQQFLLACGDLYCSLFIKQRDITSCEIGFNGQTTDGQTARRTMNKDNTSAAYCWQRRHKNVIVNFTKISSLFLYENEALQIDQQNFFFIFS